jgi:hypothetical protein
MAAFTLLADPVEIVFLEQGHRPACPAGMTTTMGFAFFSNQVVQNKARPAHRCPGITTIHGAVQQVKDKKKNCSLRIVAL